MAVIDVTGDGMGEMIAGVPGKNSGHGMLAVLPGTAGGVPSTAQVAHAVGIGVGVVAELGDGIGAVGRWGGGVRSRRGRGGCVLEAVGVAVGYAPRSVVPEQV
ncbi:hypothetical protein [Nonomuraea sp. NPDC001023]|uniref:hypothetical protein n=1 Tax=unclassified Nonomuraea TaxID=2593643 RepID=UPI00332DA729